MGAASVRAPAIGIHLWQRDPEELGRKAAEAEQLGFASVTVGDHVIPGVLPPLVACAAIAAATSRVRFGPLVLNNDLRHPVVLAQEAAALARWSGGRLELGLGAGYNRREYAQLGLAFAPLAARAARLAEAVTIIRGLLSGETVTLEGDHYVVRDASLGFELPRVPLLVGGNSAEVHAVAATLADAVGLVGYSPGVSTADFDRFGLERQIVRLQELAGQRFAELELHVLVQWHDFTPDREAAAARAAPEVEAPEDVVLDSPYVLLGTPDEIAEQIEADARRFGISRWTVFGDRPGLAPAEAFIPVLDLLTPG